MSCSFVVGFSLLPLTNVLCSTVPSWGTLRMHQRELDVTVIGELLEHVHHLLLIFLNSLLNSSVVSEENEECVYLLCVN